MTSPFLIGSVFNTDRFFGTFVTVFMDPVF